MRGSSKPSEPCGYAPVVPRQRWAVRIVKWLAVWAVTTLLARGFCWLIDYRQGWGEVALMGGYTTAIMVTTALLQERKARRNPTSQEETT